MKQSIAIIKRSLKKFRYKDIQHFPTRRTKFLGNEFYVFCSFLFKKNVSLFNSTAFYFVYETILRISKPKLYILYRALFRNDELSMDSLRGFFKEEEIKVFREERFLSPSGRQYKFNFRLVPINEFLIVSSPPKCAAPADYVHIGYDTITLWNFLRKEFGQKKIDSILEIGCGAGFLSLWMSKFTKSVTATDVNRKAIDLTELNARINNINNITTVKSDVYSNLNGRYDFIVSNPPFEFLPAEKKESLHAYGGHLGMEITLKILSGLDEHLKKHGMAYILANSYIKESGHNTLKDEIENILGGKRFAVTMKELTHQVRPDQLLLYERHKISHSISYIINVRRSEKFTLTTNLLGGLSCLKENLRVKILRFCGRNL